MMIATWHGACTAAARGQHNIMMLAAEQALEQWRSDAKHLPSSIKKHDDERGDEECVCHCLLIKIDANLENLYRSEVKFVL
jgi:hypothetical protein